MERVETKKGIINSGRFYDILHKEQTEEEVTFEVLQSLKIF